MRFEVHGNWAALGDNDQDVATHQMSARGAGKDINQKLLATRDILTFFDRHGQLVEIVGLLKLNEDEIVVFGDLQPFVALKGFQQRPEFARPVPLIRWHGEDVGRTPGVDITGDERPSRVQFQYVVRIAWKDLADVVPFVPYAIISIKNNFLILHAEKLSSNLAGRIGWLGYDAEVAVRSILETRHREAT